MNLATFFHAPLAPARRAAPGCCKSCFVAESTSCPHKSKRHRLVGWHRGSAFECVPHFEDRLFVERLGMVTWFVAVKRLCG